jgi:K+-transporting ATPase ATPase C chain
MRRDLLTSATAIVVLTVLLGLVYPLAMTAVAQVVFPDKANGSEISARGKVVGSQLIGQDFRGDPRYFQSRPSTATHYSASASAFADLGPNSKAARDTFKKNLAGYLKLERPYDPGLTAAHVPIDAVTNSASGIDPQISVANARIQAHRIAKVRGLPLSSVDAMIGKYTAGRFAGIFGEPAVNVLDLNLALDGVSS